MNSTVIFGKSQHGGQVAIYQSRVHEGHTFTFVIKRKVDSGEMAVRCQRCMSTNAKYKKENSPTKPIPYLWIKDNKWDEDPDHPKNPHFCIEDAVVNTSTARTVARQVYRKAAQSCDSEVKKPKAVHNAMAGSVRDEIQNYDATVDLDTLHREVNQELPKKFTSRRIFSYHNAKSYERMDDAFGDIPEELRVALSPRPSFGNESVGNRWILFQETNRDHEPMIIMASVAGLACMRDVVHIACDGNFKYNPMSENTPFVQMYSMHSIYQDLPNRSESVVSVIALLASKTKNTYQKCFEKVREAIIEEFGDMGVPKRFHFDMEPAAMNACHAVFPESQVTTCYFHFAKILWTK